MRRSWARSAFFVLAIAVGFHSAVGDDEFDLPTPTKSEPGAKPADSGPQKLPQILEGIVVDSDGIAVKGATVTLKIDRAKDLFEANQSLVAEKWTASTNDDGAYKLTLSEQFLEPDDDLVLQIRADGYRPLDCNIDLQQAHQETLPKQRLIPEKKMPAIDSEGDPWKDWVDDTAAFNAEPAAMVNGEPVLSGAVIVRYAGYLISIRSEMRKSAIDPKFIGERPTPWHYERLRASLVQRELSTHVEKTMLVQYLISHMTPAQRIRMDQHVDEQFEKEIEKLQRDLNVSNRTELESELHRKGTKLKNVRDNFALDRLAGESIAIHTKRFVPISDAEIQAYYEAHDEQFQRPETVDWRQVGFRLSRSLNKTAAKAHLERIRTRLIDGESFDHVCESFSNHEGFSRHSWEGTTPDSLAADELRDLVSIHPLNQWSSVIEPQVLLRLNGHAFPVAKVDLPSSSLIGNQGDARLKSGQIAEMNTSPADQDPSLGFRTTATESVFGMKSAPLRSHSVHPKSSDKFNVAKAVDPPESSAGVPTKNEVPPDPYAAKSVCLICVTMRREAGRRPIEDVRNEIRETLTKEQLTKRWQRFRKVLYSTAKIESFYGLTQFTDGSLFVSHDPCGRDLKVPESPDEKTIRSMNDWEIEEAIKCLDQAILRNPTDPAHFRDRGFFCHHLRKLDQAISDYDESIRLDSSNAITRCERAIIFLVQSNYDRALVDLDEAIRIDPKLAPAYMNRGGAKVSQGLLDQGLADLEIAVQLEPIAFHYTNRGIGYLKNGEIDKALADFDEAIRLDDKFIHAYMGRADAWSRKSNGYKVVEELDHVLRLDPSDLHARRQRGRRCMELGQFDKAMADFDRVLLIDDSDADTFRRRAYLWSRKGNSTKALADLDQAIRLNPNDADAFYNRAALHINAKRLEKAIGDVDQSIRLDSAKANAHILRGTALYRMGDYDQAVSSYSEAIRLDETNVDARIGQSDCWRQLRQYDRAVEELNGLIRLDPNNAAAFLHRGHCWKASGQLDSALADFDDAIRLFQPPDADAYAARGRLMFAKGNLAQVIADMNEAIKLNPKDAANHNFLSWWLATTVEAPFRDGRRAVELATSACELTKWKNHSYIDTLAAALAEKGDFEQAQMRLQQAIDMAPESHVETRAKMMALFKDGQPYRDEDSAKTK